MIENISKIICDFALQYSMLYDHKNEDIYRYGIEITISSLLGVIVILFLGAITKDLQSAILFLLSFIGLRSYCGGYHANSYMKCNSIFVISYIVVYWVAQIAYMFKWKSEMMIISGIATVIISIFAPVTNANKPLDLYDIKKSKIISIVLAMILLAYSLLKIYKNEYLGYLISITLALVAVMMIRTFMGGEKNGFQKNN